MHFKDLLSAKGINPSSVLVLRHRPAEVKLNKIFLWLAAERPDLFNAFQRSHSGNEKVERAVEKANYIAAFIGHEPTKAIFIGLYSNKGAKSVSREDFWKIQANIELQSLGMNGFHENIPRSSCLWFDLEHADFYNHWKGKLVVDWPPLDRSWYRWAHKDKNAMPVHAILSQNALDGPIKHWQEIDLSWQELSVIPAPLKSKLSEWRGVYYIFDTSDGKGYVGSAGGSFNLLGRWRNYADSGHGGNSLLRQRDHKNFRFSILQRVSPDLEIAELVALENSWKDRLHTRAPYGLNDN